jgi:hypothetical protein
MQKTRMPVMPQLGPHIYPDTEEGKAAYRAMKDRMEGKGAKKAKAPPAASPAPVEATPDPVDPKE